MKKIILISIFFLFLFPFFSYAATSSNRSCPDHCSNGNFYYRGSLDRSGVCLYPAKEKCEYGCDGREKCLEGKDCSSKCEGNVYYYNGYFSPRTKDCKYEEKNCEYGCTSNTRKGCADEPAVRECTDYCKSGFSYSNGKYNTLLGKCEYKKEACLCDNEGKKCLDMECSDRCSGKIAYSKGTPAADGKCKYEKSEKCENGCDNEGKKCLSCQSRCQDGNYYYNGNYQNMGNDKKACVFDEKICDAGCDDNEGCKKCQQDSDCEGKNICKNGSILMGSCSNRLSDEVTELLSVQNSGCFYSLVAPCVTGICNPFYKDMCGVIIGPAVYEDSMDGKLKPIPGALVTAVWKTSSGSEDLPSRVTDETGHANFTDEELYKYFSDKSASLEITISRENLPNTFNVSGDSNVVTQTIKVEDKMTYRANFAFGNVSTKNFWVILSQDLEKKEKSYDSAPKSNANFGMRVISWFEGIKDSVVNVFSKK